MLRVDIYRICPERTKKKKKIEVKRQAFVYGGDEFRRTITLRSNLNK